MDPRFSQRSPVVRTRVKMLRQSVRVTVDRHRFPAFSLGDFNVFYQQMTDVAQSLLARDAEGPPSING